MNIYIDYLKQIETRIGIKDFSLKAFHVQRVAFLHVYSYVSSFNVIKASKKVCIGLQPKNEKHVP